MAVLCFETPFNCVAESSGEIDAVCELVKTWVFAEPVDETGFV